MTELWRFGAHRPMSLQPGDAPKAENPGPGPALHHPFQPRAAVLNFLVGRLVVGRGAVANRHDDHIRERQTVIRRSRCRLVRNARLVESAVEPVARTVSGKHSSGTVRAIRRRCKADDQKLCVGITEWWYRLAPIRLASIPFWRVRRHRTAPLAQARTPFARRNIVLDREDLRGHSDTL